MIKSQKPFFSIVVPTRERVETLRFCMANCLSQEFSDFEIIVHDNASLDGTEDYCRSIPDARVHYHRTATRISMRENFESALSKAIGSYIIMLGDDDGLTPRALDTLHRVLIDNDADYVSWPLVQYLWPGSEDLGLKPGLVLKRNAVFGPSYRIKTLVSEALCAGQKIHFRELPRIYHGCVSRRLIDKVRAENGEVFRYDVPDVYFMAAAGLASASGLSILHPISINGGSRKSNGLNSMSQAAATESSNNAQYRTENASDTSQRVAWNPDILSIAYMTYVSLCIANEETGRRHNLNHAEWLRQIVDQLNASEVHRNRAMEAAEMTEFDKPVLDALRLSRPKAIAGRKKAQVSPHPRNLLKTCSLQTDINGDDTVVTAKEVLSMFFGNATGGFNAWPGWRSYQAAAWIRGLFRTSNRINS